MPAPFLERYSTDTLDQPVFMELFGTHCSVKKITIGSRFENLITITSKADEKLHLAFDFFNNVAPLEYYADIKTAWEQHFSGCSSKTTCINHNEPVL
jgi:hypothetical protein